jgi:hypothetical protein
MWQRRYQKLDRIPKKLVRSPWWGHCYEHMPDHRLRVFKMNIIPILIFLVGLAVDSWLLVIVWRRKIWSKLPWFASYIAWEMATTGVGLGLWLFDRKHYVAVFWWMEAVLISLIAAAVRESFLRIFVGFSSLRWFPWVVRCVIGCVLLYSGWKAVYAPPVQSDRILSFIIAGEFTFRWAFAAIGLLSLILVWMLDLPNGTPETAVMDGCTIASWAFLTWVLSRSFFGEKYTWIMQYVPELGYLLAASIWIKYMSRPEREFGFKELGITPEVMALELRRYREVAERIFGKPKEK